VVLSFATLLAIGVKNGFKPDFFLQLKALLDVLVGPVITLLSSAIGFYFGYQQGSNQIRSDKDAPPKAPTHEAALMASIPFFGSKAETAEDAEARRAAERRARREEARRWYAKLPYVVVATICVSVAALVAVLTLLTLVPTNNSTAPETPKGPASSPTAPMPRPAASAASQVISLGAKQLFQFDSDKLRVGSDDAAWNQLRQCIDSKTATSIRIVGHADCIGSVEYNLDLSKRRANAVREWILANSQVSLDVTADGDGAQEAMSDPVCRLPQRKKAESVRLLERFRRVDVVCERVSELA
jgi:outer membrane protein OmpA-like peptidoglycan-associated protein